MMQLKLPDSQLAKRSFVIFLAVVILWNVTKLPFLMAFNNDGNVFYNSHGMELSINLGHWVKGYRSVKMRTPPCNFLLVHSAMGLTLLAMVILVVLKVERRRKYCMFFYIFAICEGIHAIPASIVNDAGLAPLFILACALLIGSGVWGIWTKWVYDKDPAIAEKNMLIQYAIITTVNSFAAFLETPQIIKALKSKDEKTGLFENYGDEPHASFGHTLYDQFPEKIGMTVFIVFTSIIWVVWPILLVTSTQSDPSNTSSAEETLSLKKNKEKEYATIP